MHNFEPTFLPGNRETEKQLALEAIKSYMFARLGWSIAFVLAGQLGALLLDRKWNRVNVMYRTYK